MKRIISAGLVGILAAAFLSHSPASAHGADVCVGQGTAVTENPVYWPIVPDTTPSSAPGAFGAAYFQFGIGGCLTDGVNSVAQREVIPDDLRHGGTFIGNFTNGGDPSDLIDLPEQFSQNYCGHSEGNLALGDHLGHWVSAGSMLLIYGGTNGINGVANAVAHALGAESCLTGADVFLVTGAVVLA